MAAPNKQNSIQNETDEFDISARMVIMTDLSIFTLHVEYWTCVDSDIPIKRVFYCVYLYSCYLFLRYAVLSNISPATRWLALW